jgi:hypothetical protein
LGTPSNKSDSGLWPGSDSAPSNTEQIEWGQSKELLASANHFGHFCVPQVQSCLVLMTGSNRMKDRQNGRARDLVCCHVSFSVATGEVHFASSVNRMPRELKERPD